MFAARLPAAPAGCKQADGGYATTGNSASNHNPN